MQKQETTVRGKCCARRGHEGERPRASTVQLGFGAAAQSEGGYGKWEKYPVNFSVTVRFWAKSQHLFNKLTSVCSNISKKETKDKKKTGQDMRTKQIHK